MKELSTPLVVERFHWLENEVHNEGFVQDKVLHLSGDWGQGTFFQV